jgi:hypothetical protein
VGLLYEDLILFLVKNKTNLFCSKSLPNIKKDVDDCCASAKKICFDLQWHDMKSNILQATSHFGSWF